MTAEARGRAPADQPVVAMDIRRRAPAHVQIDIAYCGICHSDLHTVRSEWPGTRYPMMRAGTDRRPRQPGPAGWRTSRSAMVIARSTAWSAAASTARPATKAWAVCENGFVGTYNGATADARSHTRRLFAADRGRPRLRAEGAPSGITGGRGRAAAVRRHHHLFARHWGAGPERSASSASAGSATWASDRSCDGRCDDCVRQRIQARGEARKLDADEVVIFEGRGADARAQAGNFDFILDTVAASHDRMRSPRCSARRHQCLVGAPDTRINPNVMGLIFGRKAIAGS